jgi:hypothetical protein
MGGMVINECSNKQRKSCITQTNYKNFQGGYKILQLDDVYIYMPWIYSKNTQI